MTDNVFWPLQRPEDIPKNQTNWPTFAPPQWQTFTPPLTLMNTVGVRHPSSDKKRSLFERFILTLLRHTTPPHRDNETAAAFLVEEIAENIGEVEWCIVRPDTLINGPVSDYEIVPAPTTGIFSGRPTTRANVAHFMKTLLEDRELWAEWKFNAPVIMNDN